MVETDKPHMLFLRLSRASRSRLHLPSEAYALNLLRYGARRCVPVALVAVVAWSPLESGGLIGRSALEADVDLDLAVSRQTHPQPRLLEFIEVPSAESENCSDLPPVLPEGHANAQVNHVHRGVIRPMNATAFAWAQRQLSRNHGCAIVPKTVSKPKWR